MKNKISNLATLFAAPALIFTMERSARAGSWTENPSPKPPYPVAHNFTPTLGTNVVTLAPWYGGEEGGEVFVESFELNVLTDAPAAGGYYLETYNSDSAAWSTPGQAYQGIVAFGGGEYVPQYVVGWTVAGTLYVNDIPQEGAPPVGSYAWGTDGSPYALVTSTTSTTGGFFVWEGSLTGNHLTNWSNTSNVAEQITTDSITGWQWYLDNHGRVWEDARNGEITNSLCGNNKGTIDFVQIAVKAPPGGAGCDGTDSCTKIYGLSGGAVYWIQPPLEENGGCWGALTTNGSPPDAYFLSIATDNGGSPAAQGQSGFQVWASDSDGNIWAFN
jgi:hypothetical protein